MGTLLFIIALVAGIYVMSFFLRDRDNGSRSSRAEVFALGYPRASMPIEPIVTPVDEQKEIPARLPQVSLDYVSNVATTPPTEQPEASPNFTVVESPTEASLLYRTLVLGIFAIAAISMDGSAGTQSSWVGISFVAIGNVWSWHRRHYFDRGVNKIVSIASLAIVFSVMVSILVGQMHMAIDRLSPAARSPGTLGLAIGMLMVSLQMGLSFHLYNRRMLGYSLASSAVLMSAAASLSQSITFVVLLSGFIGLLIPALMLDYRSRLSLKPIGISSFPSKSELPYRHLPWRYLSQLAAIAIGLGIILSIFLSILHFPNLALKPNGSNNIQTLTPKNRDSNSIPQLPPDPSNTKPPIPLDVPSLTKEVLGKPVNNNYPNQIKQENLQLPADSIGQLQQFTQQILATSRQPLSSDFDRAVYVGEYLKQHYRQAQTQSANLPPLDATSIQQLIANCSAQPQTCQMIGDKQDLPVIYTAMLRSIGIPTRLRTGAEIAPIDFQTQLYSRPPEGSPSQTEVYFPNWGWFSFDSNPNRRSLFNLDSQQIAQLQEKLQQQLAEKSVLSSPVPISQTTPQSTSNNPLPQTNLPKPFDNSLPTPTSPNAPPEPPKDLDLTIFKAIAAIVALGGGIAWYLLHRHQQQQYLAKLHPIEQIYRSMLVSLSKKSRFKLPTQTQLEYARSISTTEHPQIAKVVGEISHQYTAWRYGKHSIDPHKLMKKLQYLQHLQQLAADRHRQQWLARIKSRGQSAGSPRYPGS
jgi:hypothetical protein